MDPHRSNRWRGGSGYGPGKDSATYAVRPTIVTRGRPLTGGDLEKVLHGHDGFGGEHVPALSAPAGAD